MEKIKGAFQWFTSTIPGIVLGIGIILIFLVGVPYGIDRLYFCGWSQNIEPNTMFSASDILTFYGSVLGYFVGFLGAIFAIYGVFETIKDNQKATREQLEHNKGLYEDERRRNVIPLIVLIKKRGVIKQNLFESLGYQISSPMPKKSEENKQEPTYQEYEVNKLVFTITSQNISGSDEFPATLKNYISHPFMVNGDGYLVKNTFEYIPVKIKNVGNGAAVNTLFTLYKEGYENSESFCWKSEPVNLTKEDGFELGFFFDIKDGDILDDFVLKIHYYDIYNEEYYQLQRITHNCVLVEINQIRDNKEASI